MCAIAQCNSYPLIDYPRGLEAWFIEKWIEYKLINLNL